MNKLQGMVYVYPYNPSWGNYVDEFTGEWIKSSKHKITPSYRPGAVGVCYNAPPKNSNFPIQILTRLYNLKHVDGFGDDLQTQLDTDLCMNMNQAMLEGAQRAEIVITTSKFWQKRMMEEFNIKSNVIHLGINMNIWKPFSNLSKRQYFTFYNTTRPATNISNLIHIAKAMPKEKFVAFGSGCYKDIVEGRYRVEVPPNIDFQGWIGNLRVTTELLHNSKANLVLSSEDDLNYHYLTPMAIGTPLMTVKGSSCEELVDDEVNGFIAEDSLEGVLNTLEKINTMDLQKYNKILKEVRPSLGYKGFDIQSNVNKLDNLISNFLKDHINDKRTNIT
ncbi:MAG: glycosyltransferase [Asgard group archaeon]|nr:glycosyltransferase [Asgard group archaeon]